MEGRFTLGDWVEVFVVLLSGHGGVTDGDGYVLM